MFKQILIKIIGLFDKPERPVDIETKECALKISPNDTRDYKLNIIKAFKQQHKSLTKYADIKSQGRIGSCGSHAICTAMEMMYKIRAIELPQDKLSELFHYYIVRQNGYENTYPSDSGQTLRNGFRVAQHTGIAPEVLHKYNTNNLNKKPNSFARSFARFFKCLYYYRLHSIDDIKTAIMSNKPVIVGLTVTYSFMNPTGDVYEHKYLHNYGGHAVVVTAYDDNDETLEIVNSWGYRWGNKGTLKIKYNDFKRLYFEAWALDIDTKR